MTSQTDGDLERLLEYLRDSRGFDFTGYKRSTLSRRIQKRMEQVGTDGYAAYTRVVRASDGKITDVACWAHARRKLDEARFTTGHPLLHEALGWVLLTPDLDFAAAAAEFRKAEKLAPADAGPKFALSFLFAAQGRLAEAENIMRQTLALDPLGVIRYLNLARILIAGGRYDEAKAALRNAIELQPAAARLHAYLTTLDVIRGDAAAALQDAQLEPKGFWRDYALALALQIQNDRGAADASLQKLIDENAVSGPFQIATVYGLRKEPDKMFEWLERAYTEHDPGLTQLLGTPFLLNYRDDPRFAALCQKLKVQWPPAAAPKP